MSDVEPPETTGVPEPPAGDVPAGLGETATRSFRQRRREKKAARSKLRRRLTRGGIGVVLLIVAIVAASGIYLWVRLGEIGHITVHNEAPIPKSGVNAGADDILLVGSTDRCAVKPAKNFEAWVKECAAGVTGNNSDVVMILRLVPGRTPTLLSIPRDTFVPDSRANGSIGCSNSYGCSNKIDAALYDGPSQLVKAIEEDFGIPINHFVVLNFETFTQVVNALGGITMYFPTTLKDNYSGLDINRTGCLHISGAESLALVRARHMYYHYDPRKGIWLGYDGSGDIGRIERDHIFLKVLGQQVSARGLGNPLTDNNLLSALAPDLTVDNGFSATSMAHLILDFHAKASGTKELTLPIVEDTQTYYYKGGNYGDVVFPVEPQDQQAIDEFMGGSPAGASVRPSAVTVSVVDANGSAAATSTVQQGLSALGYSVTSGAAVTPVGTLAETTVTYSSDSHLADAERVLRSLSGAVVLEKAATVGGADVTVSVGTDVTVDAPASATVAAAVSQSVSAVTVSAVSSSLAAPTTATSKIPPYDPRACPVKH